MTDGNEDEDSNVFEIDDFTAASEWERFIYRIEEIIGVHGWKLDNYRHRQSSFIQTERKISHAVSNDNATDSSSKQKKTHQENIKWEYQAENLKFATFEFTLQHHKLVRDNYTSHDSNHRENANDELPIALLDAMDFDFDFIYRTHPVGRWFGVKEFLILSPSSSNKEEIKSESRTQLLWSSVGIAMTNLKCPIPVFIKIGGAPRNLFYGLCIDGGFRVSYEMIHLIYTPHQCNHVHGMIETFKSKLACSVESPISVSIRFTYVIRSWAEELICYNLHEIEAERALVSSYIQEVPFGPMEDPVSEILLAVIWPCISSELIVDDESSSELNAFQAPIWKLKTKFVNQSQTLLHENLKRYLNLCMKDNLASTKQIVRSLSTEHELQDKLQESVSNALDRLAEPVPSLASTPFTSAVTHATRKMIKTNLDNSPLSDEILDVALDVLFPDARIPVNEADLLRKKFAEEQLMLETDKNRSKDIFRHFKAAPPGSLIYKTSILLCAVHSIYGVKGFAHLWHEFVLEMRFRFENNIPIPLLAQTTPNLNYNLIHQKIQMLNYCIERRKNRDDNIENSSPKHSMNVDVNRDVKSSVSYKDYSSEVVAPSRDATWNELLANISSNKESESDSGSEDEFFEAKETISEKESSESLDPTYHSAETLDVSAEKNNLSLEGVKDVTDMKLLLINEHLRIPVTQEPAPMTEDMLVEQQEILTQLGTSEEATRIRAQMQSASLLSDMEAFKAANPGCVLADFVRWYSPNDWLPGNETEEEKEELDKYKKKSNNINLPTTDSFPVEEISSAEFVNTKHVPDGWLDADEDILMSDDDDAIDKGDNNDDITEEEPSTFGEIGRLSLRMRMPGNTWKEVWDLAKPVPVKRQKRLFDDTKEGEKVLHYLSNLTPSEIALQLFPTVIMAALSRIQNEEDSVKHINAIEKVAKKMGRLSHPTHADADVIKEIVSILGHVEWELGCLTSLRTKFNEIIGEETGDIVEDFIVKLLSANEIAVNGAANSVMGKIIKAQLELQKEEDDAIAQAIKHQQEKILNQSSILKIPDPFAREYILRTSACRPSPSSRPSPQRLYTVITSHEFRMAGTFCSDTNFI